MFEIILTIGFSLLFLIISVIIIVWKNKKIRKKIEDNKTTIEVIYIIASIFTVISIFLSLTLFYIEQERVRTGELENQKALLYALRDEIDTDISFAEHISNNTKKYLETDEVPIHRFSTITIIEVINRDIGDIQFKSNLRRVYNRMESSNRILENLPLFIPLNQEQVKIYFKLKKEHMNLLIKRNDEIKLFLYDLRLKVDSLIQSV